MTALEKYREEIDHIDSQLAKLFEARMDVVLKVAAYKKKQQGAVLHPNREEEVIKKATAALKNKFYSDELAHFFQDLMAISKNLQHQWILNEKQVGFAGIEGSYSEEACINYFGESIERVSCPAFEDVFIALKNKDIRYGIIPLENSTTGKVKETLNLLDKYDVQIVDETVLDIKHRLIGLPGASLEGVEEIHSHSQGMEQSSRFLDGHKQWKLVAQPSTSISAKYIKDMGDPKKAAIASDRAAAIYGLAILNGDINNIQKNDTKFIVIEDK